MNVQEAIQTRRSVRAYTKERLSQDELNAVLESAYLAPAAGGNRKMTQLIVVQNPELLSELSQTLQDAMNFPVDPFYGAPTLVIITSSERLEEPARFANAGVILENMQLTAHEMGLGSCINWGSGQVLARYPKLLAKLGVTEGTTTIAGIVLGHAAKETPARKAAPTLETRFIA